jgi:hypothetical protein
MTNDELNFCGYELCEFGGECDICNGTVADLFFHRTNYEVIEGDYYCKECAEEAIKESNNFYETFEE